MTASIGDKATHVRHAAQTRNHHFHWVGCTSQVPPAMWGCKSHWYRLPAAIRNRIWRSYRAGQEQDGRVSAAYLAAAGEARVWILQLPEFQQGGLALEGDGS